MKFNKIVIAVASAVLISCTPKATDGVDPRVDELLAKMTLEEKIGQMVLLTSDWDVTGPTMREGYKEDIRSGKCGNIFNAFTVNYVRDLQRIAVEETRLGIPILFGYDVIHGHRTIFPLSIAEACSWDMEAIENGARVAAREAAASGLQWTFAPMCDVSIEPRWGRVSEGAGEDPFLGSAVARARVKGFQGDDLADPTTVLACVKHFAGYGAPLAGRDYNTVDMSERMFRDWYMPPYKAAVEAGALSIMNSFNELDGIPATANHFLLKKLLREDWGFKGFVVTDYTSINEMVNHGYAADDKDAARLAVNAGVDMDLQGTLYFEYLKSLVEEGKVSEKTIDEAVRRILNVKAKLGLFDDPYLYLDEQREAREILSEENLEAARDMARKSMVLLKNDGALPLRKGEKIAVIGSSAASQNQLLGSWRAAGEDKEATTILDALKAYNGADNVIYAEGAQCLGNDRSGFGAALSAARRADKVVMVLAEPAGWTGEAASRAYLTLPGVQRELLQKVADLGKPVVLVVMAGRPLDLSMESETANAILDAWFPGTMGGYALTDVLFGEYNPSGKLVMTFPRTLGQVPIYYANKNTGRPYVHPEAKYESRYLDCPNTPLYPFGYGLSYTTFAYSAPKLSADKVTSKTPITVSVDVTNTGKVSGEEVVQMYIRDLVGSTTRPVRQLKGFEKISLAPGQTKTVTFTIDADLISFWRADMTFGPEEGDFHVFVGGDSDTANRAEFAFVK